MNELVFIVDDEVHIRKLLELGLREEGFVTRAFPDGSAFLLALSTTKPDIIILDWMMPPPDGEALIKEIRENPRLRPIPVIMLTARTGEKDRIAGLMHGADDYVTKPFSLKELSMRIHALIRRDSYLKDYHDNIIVCGELELNEKARIVYKNGEQMNLTMREFDLLEALMKNQGRVLTRDILFDTVWKMELDADSRTVDVHIRYLRKKLDNDYIQTVRGIGYRISDKEGQE
ncbi:response regulator transcription factor [Christensenellaceae bacterium OttesenSCG-928-M15]|nr:response regulator transcription factor [Christensenellaceae bacterium OttesenSCG-928-M15]